MDGEENIEVKVEVPAADESGVSGAVADAVAIVEVAQDIAAQNDISPLLNALIQRLDEMSGVLQLVLSRVGETYENLSAQVAALSAQESITQEMIDEATEVIEEETEGDEKAPEIITEKVETETIEIPPSSEPATVKTEEVQTRKRRWI
mgnify:CR=1 FL=1